MASRGGARATRSMLASSAAAGIFRLPSSCGWGSCGKSSTGSTRRWKLEPPLRISTSRSASRDSISTVGSASERATSAKRRPGRRIAPPSSTSAPSVVSSPRSRSVAARVTRPSSALRSTPERAWVAARVETARETIESFETRSSRLVVSFKESASDLALLSWVRTCGESRLCGRFGAGCHFRHVESAVEGWGFLQRGRLSALVAHRVVDSSPQLPDLLGQLRVLVEACFDAAQRGEAGAVGAAAEETADLGEREVGEVAGEEDRHLPCAQRRGGPAGADQL